MGGWPLVRLADLGDIVTGATPNTKDDSFFGGDIPFVTPSELDQPLPVTTAPRSLSLAGLQSVRSVPKDAVMVCCIASLGKVGIAGCDLATNQQINSIIFNEKKVFPRYGLYACRRLKPELVKVAPATTVPIISKSKFQSFEIPLPPLEEQKRIAAILDQADYIRRKRQHAIDRLNQLGQVIFNETFRSEVTTVRISEYLDDIQSGKSLVGVSDDDGSDFRVLKISAVSRTGFRPSETKPLPSNYIPPSEHLVSNGDLIFSRANTTELIGIPCIVEGVEPNVALPDKLWRLVAAPQKADRNFLNYALRSPSSRQQIEKMCSGTSGSMQNISMQKFNSILIPKAHLGDQKKFAERVSQVSAVLKQATVQQRTANSLFASLQHRAFAGAL
jgi:type I restriction enzyme S subunit